MILKTLVWSDIVVFYESGNRLVIVVVNMKMTEKVDNKDPINDTGYWILTLGSSDENQSRPFPPL